MPEHELTDDEINEIQQSWDLLTRSTGGLREAGIILNQQLLTAQPHHIRSFEKFKKYKDFDDILKSPEFKTHSYSTVREISLVITNLKHPGVFTQLTQSIGFAHRRANTPPQQMVDFKTVFINDFIPSQMADRATPNTLKAWDKFMTVFINHVKEGLQMETDPTRGHHNNLETTSVQRANQSKNQAESLKQTRDQKAMSLQVEEVVGEMSQDETGRGMTAVTRSIQLTPSKTEMRRRKKRRGCCC